MALSKETWRMLYAKLDAVGPVPYDCGTLCGKACCGVSEENWNVAEDAMGIYLNPGEDLLLQEDADWLTWNRETVEPEDLAQNGGGFPDSYLGKQLWFVRCKDPLRCHRETRPLQCRTFPVLPHLTAPGTDREHLILIWNDIELPYECPIIEEEMEPDPDWLRAVHEVWKILMEDPDILEMLRFDSEDRILDIGPPPALWPKHTT